MSKAMPIYMLYFLQMLFGAIPAISVRAIAVFFTTGYAKETNISPFILFQTLTSCISFYLFYNDDGSLVLSYFTK
jgi:hypothetical protein